MHGQAQADGSGRGFRVLRHRDFRLFWVGAVISFLGVWMEMVARNWLIYDMTGSALLVGLNGLFMTGPFILMSLYAGTVVDRLDRRKVLIWVETLNLASFLVLAMLVATGQVQIWQIYATSTFNAMVGAFESPARSSLLPYLVPRNELIGAISLFSVVRRGTQIIGPALGGLAVANLGVGGTYFLTAGTYAVLPLALLLMRVTNPPEASVERNPFKALQTSFGYLRGQTIIGTILLLEAAMSIFGYFTPMMVVFARDIYQVGAEGLGILQSAMGAGSVAGSLGLAAVGDVRHKGRLMLLTGVIFGIGLAAFAACPWFLLALPILVVIGAADMLMGTVRVTVIQLVVEPALRGRVMSVQSIATRGISPLGGFQMGTLASFIGVQWAVALGGLVCVIANLIVAARVPAVRRITDIEQPSPAARPSELSPA